MRKMKKITMLAALILASISANAEYCTAQYQPTKPKVITRTKVVERVIEKPVIITVKETVEKRVSKKNRIAILGGVGPARLTVTSSEAKVDQKAVFGLQYQRVLEEGLSVGIQAQSNSTVLGSVGIEF
jgi:hypothetical protein